MYFDFCNAYTDAELPQHILHVNNDPVENDMGELDLYEAVNYYSKENTEYIWVIVDDETYTISSNLTWNDIETTHLGLAIAIIKNTLNFMKLK